MLGQEMDYSQGLPTPVSGLGSVGQLFETDTFLLFALALGGAFYLGYKFGQNQPKGRNYYRTPIAILRTTQAS